jgi:hypothetical protein
MRERVFGFGRIAIFRRHTRALTRVSIVRLAHNLEQRLISKKDGLPGQARQ